MSVKYIYIFSLIIDLYFLIPAVTPQTFNLTAELAILARIPTAEAKTNKCST